MRRQLRQLGLNVGNVIERMRLNPRADWQIADVEKACEEAGMVCIRPKGGSHYKVGTALKGGRRFTIPAKRPIKAVYIVRLVEFFDREGAL